ncbi:MAG: ComF family protein [Propionibacteriaceae bacterium]|jgi:predicted amidophosphoribosyltransferase|nr:ComF family protein [Propionibacteriaceae bacterium]
MSTLVTAAADLFLGAACPGCGVVAVRLCADCAAELRAGDVAPHHKAALAGLPHWAAGPFAGLGSRLISAAKDRHRWDLLDILSERLALATAGLLDSVGGPERLWLVPLPSSAGSARRRGLDFGGRLAVGAQRRLTGAGLDVRTAHLIRPVRRVADQSGLGWADRRANLRGAYGLRPWLPPADRWPPLVLIDDVVTTGASLAEARRVLEAAGARVLGAATVAATDDRD